MLRACHDLLRPGGTLAFTTIYIAPGVTPEQYRRASRVRGAGIAQGRPLGDLLAAAGFVDVRQRDVTGAFARTTRAYLETSERYADELRIAWGQARFAEVLSDRKGTLSLVAEGAVRRALITARRS